MLVELSSEELHLIDGGFWWLFPIGAYLVYETFEDYWNG